MIWKPQNFRDRLDELLAPTDVTTLNSTTTEHGLLKKLDNNAAHFMDGQGNWSTPAGTSAPGDVAKSDVVIGNDILVITPVTPISKTLSSVVAGDNILVEIWGAIFNNSGSSNTYSFDMYIGTTEICLVTSATVGASGTNQIPFYSRWDLSLFSTSSWAVAGFQTMATTNTGANSPASAGVKCSWNTGSDDFTGSPVTVIKAFSSGNGANQALHLYGYRIRLTHQAT